MAAAISGLVGSLASSIQQNDYGNQLLSGGIGQIFAGAQARRNWKYQKKAMSLQQQYNVENMQRQFDYGTEAWNRENEYNDPRNATARWRMAGVSPTSVYGSSPGGAGVAGSISTPDSSNPSSSGNVDTQQAYRPTTTMVERQRLKNETKVADSVASLNDTKARESAATAEGIENTNSIFSLFKRARELENDNTSLRNDFQSIQNAFETVLKEKDVQARDASLAEVDAKIGELLSRKDLNEESRANLISTRSLIKAQTGTEVARKANIEKDTESKDSQIRVNEAQADQLLSQIGLNDVKRDRDKYEMFLRLINSDDAKTPTELAQKITRMFRSKKGSALSDYQERMISDYLEKIWSYKKP